MREALGRKHADLVAGGLIVLAAALLAGASARGWVGAWNDGSRLATVESLVDRHTLVIDESVFTPGTCDKLLIDGRFYSDKSPVPAFGMAVLYQAYQWATGLTVRDDRRVFIWCMTVGSSGVAYAAAVLGMYILAGQLRLPLGDRFLVTASFALATVAPVYARSVNNHIQLLAVTVGLLVVMVGLVNSRSWHQPDAPARADVSWGGNGRLVLLGLLAGMAYSIDLGAGPVLCAGTFFFVLWQTRRLGSVLLFGLSALPLVAVHHAVNYAVGGTFKPANAVPEYLLWPGSPFTLRNMTGGSAHDGLLDFTGYALEMLVGKKGFLGHNLPLFLAVPATVILLRRRFPERALLATAAFWSLGTWLLYAATSTNLSGLCCSIRWFVPLLAPGYLALVLLLREVPRARSDLLFLSLWGGALAGLMWVEGPWRIRMVPYYWWIQGAVLVSYVGFRLWPRRAVQRTVTLAPMDARMLTQQAA